MTVTDWKRPKRYKATRKQWEELCLSFTTELCWCCGQDWVDLHHLLSRAQGGDDVRENLVPVCRNCHRLIEERDGWARWQVYRALQPENCRYLFTRIGNGWQAWLEANYGGAAL